MRQGLVRMVGPWLLVLTSAALFARQTTAPTGRNVIVFVADGLRHGSVNETDTPALWRMRTQGVHFENSHSVFPTFTMANASAIATGHALGDTGIFSNSIWLGFTTFDTGAFKLAPGTPVPFLENDRVLSDLSGHFDGAVLGEDTLLAMARAHGYNTAAVGKLGPAALQDVATLAPEADGFPALAPTVIVDDTSGAATSPALPPWVVRALASDGLPTEAPTRSNGFGASSPFNNGYAGDRTHAGTRAANVVQQQWMADVTTRVLLPSFTADAAKPFALVFWSRDPDGSQHNQGDGLGGLAPGINGPTGKAGVRNADRNLQQLLAWLDAHPSVKANTDVFVTSDHGFATVSRREIDRTGRPTETEAARHDYVDATGRLDTIKGTLPTGFLAIDLALGLRMNLFDPDQRVDGSRLYKRLTIDPAIATWEHPINGHGLIGPDVLQPNGSDARVMVAANGGSDLIYVPDGAADVVKRIADLLLTFDYIDGIFVDDKYGDLPGALPMSAIGLSGASRLPRPALVVAFRSFQLNPDDLQSAVQVADTGYQEGQGIHGGFGRSNTYNNMAAMGPDFKAGALDRLPVGNVDIAPTLAHVLGFELKTRGALVGRVLDEALANGRAAEAAPMQYLKSTPANGRQTVVAQQMFAGRRYLTFACLAPVGANASDPCRRE